MSTAKLNINIDIQAMHKLGLDLNSYAVASYISQNSIDPTSAFPGWSAYSINDMVGILGLSRSTILRILKKLNEKGLVERYQKTQFIRTTKKWYDTTIGIPSVNLTPPVSSPFSLLPPTPPNNSISPKHTSPSEKDDTPKRRSSCPLLNNSPLKEKYPNGHDECLEYLQDEETNRGNKFINLPKQYMAIHKILRAGYGFDRMDKVRLQVEKKYGPHNWDYMTLANWIEKGAGQ